MPLATTATRVADNTADPQNRRIREQTARCAADSSSADRAAIDQRLAALQREWDVERVIEVEAPLTILSGLLLGTLVDRRLLGISGFAAAMLLLHNLQGWYPLLPVLRRAGVRSSREIHEEARALRRARGDFADVPPSGSPEDRALGAYLAAGH